MEEFHTTDVFPGITCFSEEDADPTVREKKKELKKIENTVAKWARHEEVLEVERAALLPKGDETFPGIVVYTELDADPQQREKKRDKKQIELAILKWYGEEDERNDAEQRKEKEKDREKYIASSPTSPGSKSPQSAGSKSPRSPTGEDPFPGIAVFTEAERDPQVRTKKRKEKVIEATVAQWLEGKDFEEQEGMDTDKGPAFPGIALYTEQDKDPKSREKKRTELTIEQKVALWYGEDEDSTSPRSASPSTSPPPPFARLSKFIDTKEKEEAEVDPFPGIVVFSEEDKSYAVRIHKKNRKKRSETKQKVEEKEKVKKKRKNKRRHRSTSNLANFDAKKSDETNLSSPFPGVIVFSEEDTNPNIRIKIREDRRKINEVVTQWWGGNKSVENIEPARILDQQPILLRRSSTGDISFPDRQQS